jgi:beta-lactamase superfamily II metal-dependent hydrolase
VFLTKKTMKGILFTLLLTNFASAALIAQQVGQQLPQWRPGFLEIHHISTGRGNSIFCIMPDGTTLLIDAGDMSELHSRVHSDRNCPIRPDHSKTAPQWIADYITAIYPAAKYNGIDYALITHYHDDHFGEADTSRTYSENGYLLTGITELGTIIRIHTLIDRGTDEPVPLLSREYRDKYGSDDYHIIQTLDEYLKFVAYQASANGLVHQKFVPGAGNQLVMLRKPEIFSSFSIRNLFGNGKIWYGSGDSCFQALPKNHYPGENPLSLGIKITYGTFDYYTGGDISGMDGLGQADNSSMEAQAAPVTGSVDVATLNHHGNRDSQSPSWIRSLRPAVWVQQSWSSDHPGEEVLRRITSSSLYPGSRDLYATCMCEANKTVIGPAVEKSYTSSGGHVVIRVMPGGDSYFVMVANDSTEFRTVNLVKKYHSR